MQFSKVTMKDGELLDKVLIDSEELDRDCVSDCTAVLLQLKNIAEENLRIAATGTRNEIKNALQKQFSAMLPLQGTGNAVAISLSTPSLAIDNPRFKEDSDLHFHVWVRGDYMVANLIIPSRLSENSARSHCDGMIAGSALRSASDEDSTSLTWTEEARIDRQILRKKCIDEILAARPCIITEIIDSSDHSNLHDLAVNISVHFAAAIFSRLPV